MTREIKFRAWDKKDKKMFDFNFPYFMNNHEVYKSSMGSTPFTHSDVTKKLILMQYTGLKDKNGKEIYEGDIVLIIDDYQDSNHEVIFGEGCFYLKGHEQTYWFPPKHERKIIGNIYENKNLLEE